MVGPTPCSLLYNKQIKILNTGNACIHNVHVLHSHSTDAVFPHGLRDCAEDADMREYPSQLTDGYSQSKWVAEQLVRRAMERGLPAAIYRPGKCLEA